MPLNMTTDNWKEVRRSYSFSSLSEFDEFLQISSESMSKVRRNYNCHLSTLKLYELYLERNVTDEFELEKILNEEAESFKQFAMKITCIGFGLNLRDILLRDYPQFRKENGEFLYMTSSMISKGDLTEFPHVDDVSDNFHATNFGVHCALVLKFNLLNRAGYVMFENFDTEYLPVVIMEDNHSPCHREIVLPFKAKCNFRYLGKGYVVNLFQANNSSKGLFAYVSHKFVGIDSFVKYYCVFHVNINMMWFNYFVGNLGRVLKLNIKEKIVELTYFNKTEQLIQTTNIPIYYLLRKQTSPEIEKLIKEVTDFMKEDYLKVRTQLRDITVAIADAEFRNITKKVMVKYLHSLK